MRFPLILFRTEALTLDGICQQIMHQSWREDQTDTGFSLWQRADMRLANALQDFQHVKGFNNTCHFKTWTDYTELKTEKACALIFILKLFFPANLNPVWENRTAKSIPSGNNKQKSNIHYKLFFKSSCQLFKVSPPPLLCIRQAPAVSSHNCGHYLC